MIFPKVAERMLVVGPANTTWLIGLNISARNTRLNRSRTCVNFSIDVAEGQLVANGEAHGVGLVLVGQSAVADETAVDLEVVAGAGDAGHFAHVVDGLAVRIAQQDCQSLRTYFPKNRVTHCSSGCRCTW